MDTMAGNLTCTAPHDDDLKNIQLKIQYTMSFAERVATRIARLPERVLDEGSKNVERSAGETQAGGLVRRCIAAAVAVERSYWRKCKESPFIWYCRVSLQRHTIPSAGIARAMATTFG